MLLNQIRAKVRDLHGLLQNNTDSPSKYATRDLAGLHDHLVQAEARAAVVDVRTLHEVRKLFTPSTPPRVTKEIDELIAHVDSLRKLHEGVPPSAGFTPEELKQFDDEQAELAKRKAAEATVPKPPKPRRGSVLRDGGKVVPFKK